MKDKVDFHQDNVMVISQSWINQDFDELLDC